MMKPKPPVELFTENTLRKLVRETIDTNETPENRKECRKCKVSKILDDFQIKRSYDKRVNTFWISREAKCRECSQAAKRKKGKKTFHWSDRFLKRAPYVAALQLMYDKPEVLAHIIQYFRNDYERYYTAEHDRVKNGLEDMMVLQDRILKVTHANNQHSVGNRGRGDKVKVPTDATIRYTTGKVVRRLDSEQVREARMKHQYDHKSCGVLAKEYEVSYHTMRNILERKTWANVE